MTANALEVRKAAGGEEILSSGLSSGALAVYSYLLYCEDRKTYQCWPSCRSIGEAVRMSVNTVRKYVAELEEHGLIVTEPTFIITGDGRKHNGTLRYTILPIQNAVDLYNQRQLRRLEETVERIRVTRKLEQAENATRKRLCADVCNSSVEGRGNPLEEVLPQSAAVCEGRKYSRIKARRRKRPPVK